MTKSRHTLFEIRKDISLEDLQDMQPALLILYTATILYCHEYKLPCKFTSIMSDRKNVISKSKTHEDFRAFDLSVEGWTEMHIHRFVFVMNTDYRDIAAISASDLEPRAVIFHNYKGQGDHLHIQVKKNAPFNKFLSMRL